MRHLAFVLGLTPRGRGIKKKHSKADQKQGYKNQKSLVRKIISPLGRLIGIHKNLFKAKGHAYD